MAGDLAVLLADLKEEDALTLTKERLAKGDDAMKILDDSRRGMEMVGKRFASGEYFIPDLIYSGEILKEITEIVKPKLTGESKQKKLGKFLLATVAGDIHDIGKDIVGFMMDISGFEVIDLGIDVPKEKFIEAVKQHHPAILGLGAYMSTTMLEMKDVIAELDKQGLRQGVKVMVGGVPTSQEFADEIGADAWGKDAMVAMQRALELVGGKNG